MYLFILLFFVFMYYANKLKRNEILIVYLALVVGIVLVLLHSFMLYCQFDVWFEGSDTITYYQWGDSLIESWPFSFEDAPEVLTSIHEDYKYWGYMIFNALALVPNADISIASIFIRLNNLLIWMYSLVRLILFLAQYNISIRTYKNRILVTAFLLNVYWCTLLNFRDGIVSVLLIFIITELFSNKSKLKKFSLSILYMALIFFFRDELIPIIILALTLSFLITKLLNIKYRIFLLLLTFIGSFLIWYIIPLPSNSGIQGLIVSRPEYGRHELSIDDAYDIIKSDEGLVGKVLSTRFIKGIPSVFLANNSFSLFIQYFTNGFSLSWKMSYICGFLYAGISFIGYFIIFPSLLVLLLNRNDKLLFIGRKDKSFFILTILGIVLYVIGVYSVKYGSLQTRIRIPIYQLMLTALMMIGNFDLWNKRVFTFSVIVYYLIGILFVVSTYML